MGVVSKDLHPVKIAQQTALWGCEHSTISTACCVLRGRVLVFPNNFFLTWCPPNADTMLEAMLK
jgi:hypothetical protein